MYRIYSPRNWIFILHRVTGLALLAYFVAHVLAISTALVAGPETFTAVMAAFRQPVFRAVEVAIVGCVAFHGLNGLHVIASERGWLRGGHPAWARASVGATLCIWTVAAAMAFGR